MPKNKAFFNAKKEALKYTYFGILKPKSAFKMPKIVFKFYEIDPGRSK